MNERDGLRWYRILSPTTCLCLTCDSCYVVEARRVPIPPSLPVFRGKEIVLHIVGPAGRANSRGVRGTGRRALAWTIVMRRGERHDDLNLFGRLEGRNDAPRWVGLAL